MFRTWLDDSPYIFGCAAGTVSSRFNVTIKYSQDTPAYTAPVFVYTTSRSMGREPNINMNYNLTWNFYIDGGFNYLLRLHFCETDLEVTEVGQRVFDIFINNQTAERSADVIYWSGGNGIPVYRDYVLLIPNEGSSKQTLWLALHPSEGARSKFADAILNGLEIFRLNNSDGSLAVPDPEPSSSLASLKPENKQPKKGKKLSMKIVIGVSVGCTLTISLSLLLSLIFWRKNRRSYY
ncbi:hypothetical protein J1N35_002379 [Gossypium stocksii]|uniref:Malectin-like domain-containing protein n=1 Tax=Gossypium stocksii TaxID=47602 RepID=A0A9D3WMF9_9ROSI|nr:hypothetical protein J1N35_002379 [Gossypium stocksii]